MVEPALVRDGNLRLVSIAHQGLPEDIAAAASLAAELARDQAGVEPYGPACALFDLAPDPDTDPVAWRCQVGTAVIGQPQPQAPLLVEDYRQLQALCLPHHGARRELAETWRQLADHARAMGWLLRPYWRVSLPVERSADGHLVPSCVVSVFLDR